MSTAFINPTNSLTGYFSRNPFQQLSSWLTQWIKTRHNSVNGMLQGSGQLKREYVGWQNGKPIGSIKVNWKWTDNTMRYQLHSKLRSRFQLADCREETILKQGLITYSCVHKRVNGKNKDITIRLGEGGYKLDSGENIQQPGNGGLNKNLLSLYFTEPLYIQKIYAELFQQYVNIEKCGEHIYRIIFPDGSYSIYHYEHGSCVKIDLHQYPYAMSILLKR